VLGGARYLILYVGSGIAAALTQAMMDPVSHIPMIGASGAIAGVLGAYAVLYPHANVHVFIWIVIFFRIVAVPAWLMLGLWFAMQLVSALTSGPHAPGVAFWAHGGGFVADMLLILMMRPRQVELWQSQKTPVFANVPPSELLGRRTFHQGSVPRSGRPYRPRDPWN
jgi:membrane associated rhomboid family serine protease